MPNKMSELREEGNGQDSTNSDSTTHKNLLDRLQKQEQMIVDLMKRIEIAEKKILEIGTVRQYLDFIEYSVNILGHNARLASTISL